LGNTHLSEVGLDTPNLIKLNSQDSQKLFSIDLSENPPANEQEQASLLGRIYICKPFVAKMSTKVTGLSTYLGSLALLPKSILVLCPPSS
jgi:hypothetical protein